MSTANCEDVMDMSLLDDFKRPCVLMEKVRAPDGEGGFDWVWTEGAEFFNYQALDQSLQARIAEKQGVTSLYTALVDANFPIVFDDYYKDMQSGQVYRVTSKPEEKKAPESASFALKFFTAERAVLPA